MGLFWHKLLPVFLLPLGAGSLLVVIGLIGKRRLWIALGVSLLLLTSLPVVGDRMLRLAEDRFPHREVSEVAAADAIVVLSGAIRELPATWQRPEFSEAVDRFDSGLALLQAGKAPVIVFTRGRLPWGGARPPEGDELAALARARGVRGDQIVLTGDVEDTRGEAQAIARLALARGWKRVLLVTSAFHLPRAELAFRRTGLEVAAFPCDYRTVRGRPLAAVDFLPNAEALRNSETAIREFYGYWFYRLTL